MAEEPPVFLVADDKEMNQGVSEQDAREGSSKLIFT